ncbi:hypothetical protein BpHYR1_023621 [Brachionus plicatilis]|uniref:Uncharacterized protein n=1 Tax=Brachionus plicatilis TaxID=10195 RepID=A0A3M7PMX9_BRAPC|nr:hypothetical protein BpHYR1_023621 [Brachionus plicatilis]
MHNYFVQNYNIVEKQIIHKCCNYRLCLTELCTIGQEPHNKLYRAIKKRKENFKILLSDKQIIFFHKNKE